MTSRAIAIAVALAAATPALAQDGTPLPVTIGVGLGVTAPQGSPIAVDTASARFRISDSFTLSPVLGFSITPGSVRVETPGGSVETRTQDMDFSVGAEGLFAVATRGTANLQFVAGADVGYGRSVTDPEGSDNNTVASSTGVGVYYGLGVEWFLGREEQHFSVSAHGLNPILGIASTYANDNATDVETRANTISAGLIWDPSARVMAHFYF